MNSTYITEIPIAIIWLIILVNIRIVYNKKILVFFKWISPSSFFIGSNYGSPLEFIGGRMGNGLRFFTDDERREGKWGGRKISMRGKGSHVVSRIKYLDFNVSSCEQSNRG